MIPLVSAFREVELIKARIDAVAAAVQAEQGVALAYRLGVMVETPRAALRAGDLAASTAFLSFGTNDLTQMTYGLSRDDAGRFMREYVNRGVFHEDPFHSLDVEGVGELMLIAARRGRERNPDIVLGLCGEHGGDPSSVRFCKVAGFDYVSCSPFRVPIARLAAAQATLLARGRRGDGRRRMTPLPGDARRPARRAASRRWRAACRRSRPRPTTRRSSRCSRRPGSAARHRPRPDRPARRRKIQPLQRAGRATSQARPDGRGDRGRSVVAAFGRRAARRPGADRGGSRRRRRLHPLDGGAAAARRARRPDLPGAGAAARLLRPGAGRDRRRRPVRDRDRRLRRPRRALRPAGLGRRAPVHQGRGHGDARPGAGDQGRPRRAGAREPRPTCAARCRSPATPPAEVALVSAPHRRGRRGGGRPHRDAARAAGVRAALPARRRAQGRAWAESRLAESFGRLGLAALAPRLDRADSPFRPSRP